ncbi:hypothetical protein [Candidatus Uabimicrobium amorphum]|uniref:NAD-dependent protein deacetylase n=1 Tax=Uabimicrobium amorphum TaxID=2596890 RepID=A0A5S9IJ26_UABAM|nr:hypothetical protein [Candidatus Uabimicrobium amorphum]BBM82768.1 NAD-dependent protein deacetylase [Candidatus Uabimicrobium amorphum]
MEHGSIWRLQCAGKLPNPKPCCFETWENVSVLLCVLDEETMPASQIPPCPKCKGIARTNTYLFGGDYGFVDHLPQYQNFQKFMQNTLPQVAILIGSSGEVPRNENIIVRWKMQKPQQRKVISINPNAQPQFSDLHLSKKASEGIEYLTRQLKNAKF